MKGERADWFAEAAEFTPLVAVETKRGTYLVRTEDREMGGKLFVRRTRTELAVVDRLIRLLRDTYGDAWVKDRTFVDVGANIGTSTIPALLGGFADAVAIEPSPENVRNLRLNLVLNDLAGRVQVVAAAASDEVGEVGLRVFASASGKGGIGRVDGPRTALNVPAVTLDALADDEVIDPGRVGALWIDVQGHEGPVLAGAKRFVGEVPTVIEWQKKPEGETRMDAVDFLRRYTHFVDLRADPEHLYPVGQLDRFCDTREPGITDLLALNP